jgi:hypothetical protein
MVYRSVFDRYGFCDLKPINSPSGDSFSRYRDAYRKLWLEDLGGYDIGVSDHQKPQRSALSVFDPGIDGLQEIASCAEKGQQLIGRLKQLILDVRAPGAELRKVNGELAGLDREIEELGFHYDPIGSLAKMFLFAKENLAGTDPLALASQMESIYGDLGRRCEKFNHFYQHS